MDREKVIKAINICLGHGKCDDCGYRIKDGYSTMDCRKPMMRDALDILKEQEAIESINFGDKTDIMANLEGLTWDDWRMYHSDTEVQNIAKSAFDLLIALLKKQEAKEVKESTNMYTGLPITHCPKCGVSIDRYLYGRQHEGQINYCPKCGQAVKWNDS